MEPTEKQIEEFWEWCGFEEKFELDTNAWYWDAPDGIYGIDLPPIDLISLVTYAVPIARVNGVTKIVFLYFLDSVWCQLFGGFGAQTELACGKVEKPEREEDALFWALYPVITGKEVIHG